MMSADHTYPPDQIFSKGELIIILDGIVDKTLEEIDKNNVFEKARKHPGIKGIAGDVIERSVLGYKSNNKQAPDILVDGIETEVKVTGIKENSKRRNGHPVYDAKEPLTITAVSVDSIGTQEFENSTFYDKIASILIVYYQYDGSKNIKAPDYARFPIRGYEFHRFSENDLRGLKNDWTLIRDFIINNSKDDYGKLGSTLRPCLQYLDTAPSWPNRPRFRLKKSFLSSIVQQHFNNVKSVEEFDIERFDSFEELESICRQFTRAYRGKTMRELAEMFGIPINNRIKKSIAEAVVIRMFGGDVSRMRNVPILERVSVIPQTIVLNPNDKATEATKFMRIDFDEFLDDSIQFHDSAVYDYFMNNSFMMIVFKETVKDKLLSSQFLGFKRIIFSPSFIKKQIRRTWKDVRWTVRNDKLRETVELNKDGSIKYNDNGTMSTSVNFPKAKDYDVFLRGTGKDSRYKNESVCGIKMYKQNIWIRGPVMVEILEGIEYLRRDPYLDTFLASLNHQKGITACVSTTLHPSVRIPRL